MGAIEAGTIKHLHIIRFEDLTSRPARTMKKVNGMHTIFKTLLSGGPTALTLKIVVGSILFTSFGWQLVTGKVLDKRCQVWVTRQSNPAVYWICILV